jgi:hypothetical protein
MADTSSNRDDVFAQRNQVGDVQPPQIVSPQLGTLLARSCGRDATGINAPSELLAELLWIYECCGI